MRFCTECGKEITDPNNRFCMYCGAKVENIEQLLVKEEDYSAHEAVPSAGQPKKGKRAVAIWAVFVLLLLVLTAGAFVYVIMSGLELNELPVVGRFFEETFTEGVTTQVEVIKASEVPEEEVSEEELPQESEPTNEQRKIEGAKPAVSKDEQEEVIVQAPPVYTKEELGGLIFPEFVSSIVASSEKEGFPVYNILDGRNDTAWLPDPNGPYAITEIVFEEPITIYGVYVKVGYWKSEETLPVDSSAWSIILTYDENAQDFLLTGPVSSDYSIMVNSRGEACAFIKPHTISSLKLGVPSVYFWNSVTGETINGEDYAYITDISFAWEPMPVAEELMSESTQAPEATPAAEFVAQSTETTDWNHWEYVLPYSSTYSLTEEDLYGFTSEQLRIARNEIYARYGRQFNDETLQAYFDSKPWYAAIIKLPVGTEPTLTELELANINLIRTYEERLGL